MSFQSDNECSHLPQSTLFATSPAGYTCGIISLSFWKFLSVRAEYVLWYTETYSVGCFTAKFLQGCLLFIAGGGSDHICIAEG